MNAIGLESLLIFDALGTELCAQSFAHQLTHILCIQFWRLLLLYKYTQTACHNIQLAICASLAQAHYGTQISTHSALQTRRLQPRDQHA